MTSTLACPNETELLALAMGEPDAAAVRSHVELCTSCQAKLDRFQAEWRCCGRTMATRLYLNRPRGRPE